MIVSKEVSNEDVTVCVTVEDNPHSGETLVGFENRLIEIAEKLILNDFSVKEKDNE